jgi:hypothetical protein
MKYKKQHWVPKSYLQLWHDNNTPDGHEPYIWVFSKDGCESKAKAPHKVFRENEMYTIKLSNGKRDLKIEHGLSGLESKYISLYKNILSQRKPLTLDNRIILCAFIAAMDSRSQSMRDHLKKQWGEIFSMMNDMMIDQCNSTEQDKYHQIVIPSNAHTISMDEVKKMTTNPMQSELIPSIVSKTSILTNMNIEILCTNDKIGFVTSDTPCIVNDPEVNNRQFPLNTIGLGWKTVEVAMPLSPNQLAFLNWRTAHSTDLYYNIDLQFVDLFNRNTICCADKSFIVNANEKKKEWFKH